MLFSEYRHWINHAEWIVKIGYPISTRKFYFLRFCFCFLQNDNETANVRYQRMATRQNQSIFKAYGVRADRRITIQDFEWKIIDNSTKLETLHLSERWEHLRTITFSCVLLVLYWPTIYVIQYVPPFASHKCCRILTDTKRCNSHSERLQKLENTNRISEKTTRSNFNSGASKRHVCPRGMCIQSYV